MGTRVKTFMPIIHIIKIVTGDKGRCTDPGNICILHEFVFNRFIFLKRFTGVNRDVLKYFLCQIPQFFVFYKVLN